MIKISNGTSFLLALCIIVATSSSYATNVSAFTESIFANKGASSVLVVQDDPVRVLRVVRNGLMAYYKVYEQWPGAWMDVVNAGLHQIPLLGPEGHLIDPDDGEWNFYGDVSYDPTNDSYGNVSLHLMLNLDGTAIRSITVYPPVTYQELIQSSIDYLSKEPGNPGHQARIDELLAYQSNLVALQLFAIIGQMNLGVHEFHRTYGAPPESVDHLIDSGYCPVNRSSMNPWTTDTFSFDASPYDVFYWYDPESGVEDGSWLAKFIHVMPGDEYPMLRLDY